MVMKYALQRLVCFFNLKNNVRLPVPMAEQLQVAFTFKACKDNSGMPVHCSGFPNRATPHVEVTALCKWHD